MTNTSYPPEDYCPDHTKSAIDLWVSHGCWPGSFVEAVLQNDLFAAIGRADSINKLHIPGICSYVYNEIPSPCWGSREKMERWAEMKAAELHPQTELPLAIPQP